MDNRTNGLLEIRPDIQSAKIMEGMGADEFFQNKTLRPVLKLQNHLLVAAFQNYISKHKNAFYDLTLENRMLYIENTIQKDIKFRNALKGMIIGMFTLYEYDTYIQNSSALNKRMMTMVVKRLQDQIQLFERPVLV